MFMSDAQREHEEAREAPRTIEEDARTLKETVQRMEADNAAERAAIADLWAATEASKDKQGSLFNEVSTLTSSLRAQDEICQKLET